MGRPRLEEEREREKREYSALSGSLMRLLCFRTYVPDLCPGLMPRSPLLGRLGLFYFKKIHITIASVSPNGEAGAFLFQRNSHNYIAPVPQSPLLGGLGLFYLKEIHITIAPVSPVGEAGAFLFQKISHNYFYTTIFYATIFSQLFHTALFYGILLSAPGLPLFGKAGGFFYLIFY